jgi:hypothetical protein
MTPEYKLHAVVFRDGDWWVAQILEYNLATAARSLDAIPAELERFLTVQIAGSWENGLQPFEDLPKAPQRFWDLYERSAVRAPHERRSFQLPDAFQTTASIDALIAA